MPDALEYEEEEDDLFASSDIEDGQANINPAAPIAGPSRARAPDHSSGAASSSAARIQRLGTAASHSASALAPAPAPAPAPAAAPSIRPSVALSGTRPRLVELRAMRHARLPPAPDTGPMSLRQQCITVIRVNASRIWDVGDVDYQLIKDFVNELPLEQLAEVEDASPHLRKDTDWIWEFFLLENYPQYHARVAEKKGEQRTSGWRRMYKKAVEEARDRQIQAAERVAERYKELEKEKAAKRIVFMDKVVVPKKAKRGPAGVPAGYTGPVIAKGSGLFGKARADAQRTRLAMTHAAGRYIPPPHSSSARPAPAPSPALPGPSTASSSPESLKARQTPGPRIPPPRHLPSASPAFTTTQTAPPDLIPGAYPTSEYNAQRAALPAHLAGRTTASAPIREDRFVLKKPEMQQIKKAQAENFKVPVKKVDPVDYFGADRPAGVKRKAGDADADLRGSLLASNPTHRADRKERKSEDALKSVPRALQAANGKEGPARTSPVSIGDPKVIADVIFRKKHKPKALPQR